MSGDDGVVRAVNFGLARIPFTLLLCVPDASDNWGFYRPTELAFSDGVSHHSIEFEWSSGPASGPIGFVRLRDA